jgi:hypothetical protein
VRINTMVDIENLREKLNNAIEYGNFEKTLEISQELDLVILKFIMTEQNYKNQLSKKGMTLDIQTKKERSFENV